MDKIIQYWKLEEGYSTIHDESGFCAYDHDGEEFYIAHFYVTPGKNAYKFFNKVKDFARSVGAKYLSGNLHINEANKDNFTNKVLIQLKHGYKIIGVHENRITVVYNL